MSATEYGAGKDAVAARRRPLLTLQRRMSLTGLGFISPAAIAFILIIAYPVYYLIKLSLYTTPEFGTSETWVGLQNYGTAFGSTGGFLSSLWITLIYAGGGIVLQLVIGLVYALLLRERVWGKTAVLGIVLIPYLIPSVAAVAVWKWIFDPTTGVANSVLMDVGIIHHPLGWLETGSTALISVIIVGSWRQFPFVVLGIVGRLQTIPNHLYEAAKIDGASAWDRFWAITMPQLRNVLIVTVFLRFIFDFNDYDTVALLTGGGPASATRTLPVLIYQQMFGNSQTGVAAASAVLAVLVLSIMMGIYFTLFRTTEGL